jgi:hypothetical protein
MPRWLVKLDLSPPFFLAALLQVRRRLGLCWAAEAEPATASRPLQVVRAAIIKCPVFFPMKVISKVEEMLTKMIVV